MNDYNLYKLCREVYLKTEWQDDFMDHISAYCFLLPNLETTFHIMRKSMDYFEAFREEEKAVKMGLKPRAQPREVYNRLVPLQPHRA